MNGLLSFFPCSVLIQQLSSYPKIHLQEAWWPKVNSKHLTLQKSPKQECAKVLYRTDFKKLLHGQKPRKVLSIKILFYLILLHLLCFKWSPFFLYFTIGFKKLNAYWSLWSFSTNAKVASFLSGREDDMEEDGSVPFTPFIFITYSHKPPVYHITLHFKNMFQF